MIDEKRDLWVEQRIEAVRVRLRVTPAKSVLAEFEALVAMLIIECGNAGATEWPENLHLRDVFDKHLMRKLND